MAPTGNLLYVNGIGYLDVPSTSLTFVEGIQAQIDAINNKGYGAISPWATTNSDQIGKILMSDPNGKISLSDKPVGGLVMTNPTYTANNCSVSDQDGLATASTITSDELKYLTGINI